MGATMTEAPLVKSFEQLGREFYGSTWPGGDSVVQEIQKAMASQTITGLGDATPLRLENLDSTMTAVLFGESHLKLWNAFPRTPSTQLIAQWNRRHGYGSSRGQMGFTEGGKPLGGIASWERFTATIRFLGTQRGYTHQLLTMGQAGGTQLDPVAEENRNGTLALMEGLERNIMFGLAGIKDNAGLTVNYDGFLPQLTTAYASSVMDMEGRPMDFLKLEEIAERFVTVGKLLNFAKIKTYATPHVLTGLSQLKESALRAQMTSQPPDGFMPGTPMKGYATQFGDFFWEPSIMLERVEKNAPLAATDAGVTVAKPGTVLCVAASEATSKMVAGTYYYFASALRDEGETDTRASTATAVAAGEKVTVTILEVAGATGYRLYRGITAVAADARWIADVPKATAGDEVYVDLNQWRPDTGVMVFAHMDTADVTIFQLAPLIRFPLAITDTTLRFLLILYHTLQIKAGERMVFVKNIGRRTA